MLGNKEWTGLSKIVSTYRRSTPTVTATGRGFLDGQFGNAVGLCQTGVSCAFLETRWIPHWSKTSCHSPDQTVWWKNFSGHLYEWHYDTLWKTATSCMLLVHMQSFQTFWKYSLYPTNQHSHFLRNKAWKLLLEGLPRESGPTAICFFSLQKRRSTPHLKWSMICFVEKKTTKLSRCTNHLF